MSNALVSSMWDAVIGQPHAVELLQRLTEHPVHGFLLVGPEGCGKDEAARAFATTLLTGSADPTSREGRLIAQQGFADVHEIWREGASISAEMAQDIVESASRSPIESSHKIIILHEVHLMAEAAVVRLLKTFEEPTAHVVFILLADSLVPSLVTVASRCVVVQFGEVSADIIEAQLISEGIAQATAQSASHGAAGSIERARLLAQDGAYAARRLAFSSVPTSLDGSGSVALALVDDIVQRIEAATVPLEEQHKLEIEELEKRVKATGERGSGRKALLEAHKRQLRRFRSDELRSGLAVLAGVYRDAMSHAHNAHKTHDYAEAVAHVHTAMHNLGLNANETLLLQSLFLRLPIVRGAELL